LPKISNLILSQPAFTLTQNNQVLALYYNNYRALKFLEGNFILRDGLTTAK
ncbi:15305_t:CDS:1, partial [Funneliformis geosporum]